jgi:N-acetyl-anhydromuramyl-L-alanine amidase AmpD
VLVLHTPEEPPDDVESTPAYFAGANRGGSTHYYQDNDGDLYQCVPEKYGAIANGVTAGRNYPAGTNSGASLNYQSLSIEIEGYAAGMHRTCPPGSRQWLGARNWIISRALTHKIPITRQRVIGHYEVANKRTDPGTLKIDQLVQEASRVAGALVAASERELQALKFMEALRPYWTAKDFAMMHKIFHYLGVPVAP